MFHFRQFFLPPVQTIEAPPDSRLHSRPRDDLSHEVAACAYENQMAHDYRPGEGGFHPDIC